MTEYRGYTFTAVPSGVSITAGEYQLPVGTVDSEGDAIRLVDWIESIEIVGE